MTQAELDRLTYDTFIEVGLSARCAAHQLGIAESTVRRRVRRAARADRIQPPFRSKTVATIVTASPVQKLVTYALTFAQLAEQGALKQRSAPEAAKYNRERADAFQFIAHDLSSTALTLEQEIEYNLRPNSLQHPFEAWRDAHDELLREARRLLNAVDRAA